MDRSVCIVLVLVLIASGSGCAALHERESPAFVPKGNLTDETRVHGFTVRTYRSDAGEGSFAVLRDGKRAYEREGWSFFIGGRPGNIDKAMRMPPPGIDITGNGRPNLVIYEWTGGVHCCFVAHVLELGSPVRMLTEIDGRHSTPTFVDLDGDSLPEVVLRDWAFEYWPGSFATSPAPKVILRWRNGQYVLDAKLMEVRAPSPEELRRKAEEIRNDEYWDSDVTSPGQYSEWSIPPWLFQTALDLMYGGHEELGRSFIRMAWSPKYPVDDVLLGEFEALLSQSPYWTAIKAQREAGKRP
jgi:hypothetical protein